MTQYILFLLGIIASGVFNAQEADNNLQGYFMTQSKNHYILILLLMAMEKWILQDMGRVIIL